jgi:DUF4097 and DUF4098 domain-containing protein YvlB
MKQPSFKHRLSKRYLFVAAGVAGLAFTLAALPAQADDWSKTYTISGKPDLRVDTSDANIRVSTWDQNTIEARVTTSHYKIGDNGIRIAEHQSGDSVEIDVRFPHSTGLSMGWSNRSVEIDISMPREGRVDLHTGDGRIDLGNFKGEMQLRSGDGSEEIENVDGILHATTGDGHIRANGRFDELDLKTGDGRLDARAFDGSAIGPGWKLESGDGSVTLEVPANLAADVDLHTGDGHIDLDMPVTTEGKIREGEVRGKMNGGGGLLRIHTGDGSIRLRKL